MTVNLHRLGVLAALYVAPLECMSYAQNNSVQFEHISIESGLSQSSVLSIYQDKKGFLWFATYKGLNRYDGLRFKIYENDAKDPTSISKNNVEPICEDHLGYLWIGTEDGLNQFDRNTETFTTYKNDPANPNSISANFIRSIFEDKDGNLWIGTQEGGLNLFDRRKKEFRHYQFDPNNPKSLSQNNVLSIKEDKLGQLWIGTDGGLNCFNKKTGEFKRYQYDPKNNNSISHNSVWRVYFDRSDNLWAATWGGGLNLFNRKENRFIRYQNNPKDPASLSNNTVRAICEDSHGHLWLGTSGGGLELFIPESANKEKGHFVHFKNDIFDPNSLSGNTVLSIFEDRSGIIWIGTDFNGLNKYNPAKGKFELYRNRSNNVNSLASNNVGAIFEDHEGFLWIGTNTGDLDKFDRKTRKFTHITYDIKTANSPGKYNIKSIGEDKLNRIWIGTVHGLFCLDEKNHRRTAFRPIPNDDRSISNYNVWSIFKDKSGNLWIGTFGGGLDQFNYETNDFTRYMHHATDSGSISDNLVLSICEDTDDNLWVGTVRGLNHFNTSTKTFTHYQPDSHNPKSISYNKVTSLLQSKAGYLWIGTANGLNKFDPKTKDFQYYNEKNELTNNTVQGLMEDSHGNIWICTIHGLSKFDPVKRVFKNFYESSGLQGNEFNPNSRCHLRNGDLAIGGVNGLNIFTPDSIFVDQTAPQVVFTDFQIFNKSVAVGTNSDGREILNRSISENPDITLSYKDNFFSFEFAALHYISPKDNKYAYKMEGFDKEWHTTSASMPFVSYTNLPAGKYTFHVKAANHQGTWNNIGVSVRITILPPWWNTWLFKLFAFLTVISILTFTYFSRVNNFKKQQIKLEALVLEKTAELQEINSQLTKQAKELNEANALLREGQQQIEEQQEELLAQKSSLETMNKELSELISTKDKLFSIVAHDIKNPFHAIMGFSKMLESNLDVWDNEKKLQILKLIITSSKNLLQLLDNLLHWSRAQRGKLDYYPDSIVLKDVIDSVTRLMKESAESKNIGITTNLPNRNMVVFADTIMLETIIRNLVSNAIKFTNTGGHIEITAESYDHFVTIKVIDDGIGMDEDSVKGLFKLDTNISSQGTENERGTGLGLLLVKEFVTVHNGKVGVKSKTGEGSTFFFTLPSTDQN